MVTLSAYTPGAAHNSVRATLRYQIDAQQALNGRRPALQAPAPIQGEIISATQAPPHAAATACSMSSQPNQHDW
jgi:hypothetical protein